MKTLIFEGAGWAGADTSKGTDVSNCRIRTRIRNIAGRVIYLEMGCCKFEKKQKYIPKYAEGLEYATHIDHLFYDNAKWDKKRNHSSSLSHLTNVNFEYNKENILKFVNENLNCSFENMTVINEGLFVFKDENPLCDCSNGHFKPFKDIEININKLNNIKPIQKWEGHHQANYRISYNSLMQLPYMKRYIEERTEKEKQNYFKNGNFQTIFRWDDNGIITSLELHAGCCMSVGAEDIETIIDLIIKDNKEVKNHESIKKRNYAKRYANSD